MHYLKRFLFLIIVSASFFNNPLLQAAYYPKKPDNTPTRTYRQGPTAISTKLKNAAPIDPVLTKQRALVEPPANLPHIMIDPGHGGEDFGTYSITAPKYQEKLLTLSSAIMLKRFLQQLGYKATLTRKDDTFIPLDERAAMANRLQPILFVSIHYNSAPSSEAEGIEIYYYKSEENKKRSKQSKELAHNVLEKTLNMTQAKSRGVRHGNFAVIRETHMPAILIEGGFLTHPDERARIKNPNYLKQLAWGIAMGIDDYVQSNK